MHEYIVPLNVVKVSFYRKYDYYLLTINLKYLYSEILYSQGIALSLLFAPNALICIVFQSALLGDMAVRNL